jgi:hypothetical protein
LRNVVDRELTGVTRAACGACPGAAGQLLLRRARGHDRLPAGSRDNMAGGVVRRDEHDCPSERLLGCWVVLRQQPTGREQERRHQDRTKGPTQGLHDESIPGLPDDAVPRRHRRERGAAALSG